ncbi:MAG: GNAT family N-acetyltransferase [Burkholderiales bacterium]|nr:GNAT family N-acetyltransferase [Burkholderiales bacterium]
MHLPDSSISLRGIQDSDRAFLISLYASVREEELRPTGWSDAQKNAFIASQFQAQHQAYAQYPNTEFFLVLQHAAPVGRIYLQHREQAILIVDVSLIAAARGQGIGSALLQAVSGLATTRQKSVQIHVEKFNPALRLYQRLGFQLLADKGVYLFLEWRPQANGAGDSPPA